MNFNHDIGLIDTILTIDTTNAPPLGGQTNVLVINGNGAIKIPAGATGVRPSTPAGGMLRFNNDSSSAGLLEFYDGTSWQTVAASSGSVSSVTVTTTTGLSVSSGSSQTITNSGTFALVLGASLQALNSLASTGFVVQTGASTFANRSITGTAGNIVVGNGTGVSASPSIDLASISQAASGSFVKVTLDGFGRVTGNTAVVQSDITGLVDSVYVNATGDTMTGNLDMGNFYVTMNNAPVTDTQAANKAYVDAVAAGLTWKQAVATATTANLAATYANGTAGVGATLTFGSGTLTVDGVVLANNDRVLVKNQTATAQNGLYVVSGIGSTAVLTRSTATDQPGEFYGATVYSIGGTVNASTGWTQTEVVATVGTDPVIWTQFSGSSTYNWGDGLSSTGNTVFINMGAGIATLPSDEVGIDLFAPTSGGLILTTDGSTTSTNTAAKLHLLLSGSGGLSQSAAGLAITTGGVTNAMLVNSSFTIDVDGPGSKSVALGSTLNIFGTANRIATSISSGNIIVDISANYVGQSTITTLGTITTGTWNGTVISSQYGGTGVNTSAAANGQLLIGTGSGLALSTLTAGTGINITNASGGITINNTGVTSVALSAPAIFTVTGSPVTTTGSLSFSLNTQTLGTVLAGPVSGGAAVPTFRALAYSDLPLRLYAESPGTVTAPVATGTNSIALGSGSSSTQFGASSFSGGSFTGSGDAQHGNYILRTITTNATPTELFLDNASIQYIVPVNSVVTFTILIAARRTDATGGGAGYKFEGVARRDASAASVTVIGAVSKTVLGETNSTWDATVSADTSTGGLRVFGTAEAAKTVRWVAVVQTAEVKN